MKDSIHVKKIIALTLLGMMLMAVPMAAMAQGEMDQATRQVNPLSGEELEAISKALNADVAAAQKDIHTAKAAVEESADELDAVTAAEAKKLAHLAEMENWSMGQKLRFATKMLVLGMIVVMSVLILIAVITGFLNNLEIKHEEEIERRVQAALKEKGALAPATAPAAAAASSPSGIDGVTVAAIAGAVTAVLRGRPFRIKSLKLASNVGSSWSQHGRQTIMASHSLERKSR